ncbi:MAG: diacylglycerol kinase family protein [Microbacterium sp.]
MTLCGPALTAAGVERDAPPELTGAPRRTKRAAVVVNAAKLRTQRSFADFRRRVDAQFALQEGWSAPLWLPTTAESRGAAETRIALETGADIVLVAGGDGTIRTVAEQLGGTGVPMGLIPLGTGNLLARNLGTPVGDVVAAVRLACDGADHRIDLGWLEVDTTGRGDRLRRHAFVVMAGAGIDADIMAGADPVLKKRFGSIAYVLSGLRAIRRSRARGEVRVDGSRSALGLSHGLVVGNCGRIQLGVPLLPDASPSDGILDGFLLTPRTGWEWLGVAWAVLHGRRSHRLIPRYRGRVLEYRSEEPIRVEVDGDVIGVARRVRAWVHSSGLVVRCA